MICPKCGSETKLYRGIIVCSNNVDCNNNRGFTNEDELKMKHQARLDKVLSKFRQTAGEVAYRKRGVHIRYLDTFYLLSDLRNHNKISLKTVESLLEDLEK